MQHLSPTTRWHHITWGSYWAVMLAFAINTAVQAPDGAIIPVITAGMTFWLIQTIVLWAFLPALKQQHPRRLSWFGYVLLIYLPFCMVGAFQPPHLPGALLVLTLTILFVSNAYWVRALKREAAG